MNRLVSLLFCLLLSAPAMATDANTDAEIRVVIEAFRSAIIDRDRARFVALFAPGPVVWQSVRGDMTLQRLREKDPQAPKVRISSENNPHAFIDEIVSQPKSSEETFSNIRIDSDGEIAAVLFDYRFLRGGR